MSPRTSLAMVLLMPIMEIAKLPSSSVIPRALALSCNKTITKNLWIIQWIIQLGVIPQGTVDNNLGPDR